MLFHKTIEITPSSITTTSLDEELVRKALHFVEENIDNPEKSTAWISKKRSGNVRRLFLIHTRSSVTLP